MVPRHLISILLSLLLASFVPLACLSKAPADPVLAVFSSFDFPEHDWEKFKVDVHTVAVSWDSFPVFLQKVKEVADGRPVLLDIQVHGNTVLWVDKGNKSMSGATLGWVLNQIRINLGEDNLTLLLEACYAGDVYKKSIRNSRAFIPYRDINKIGDYLDIPKYPIYGIRGEFYNVNNLTFLQYNYNSHLLMVDLRDYEIIPIYKQVSIEDKQFEKVIVDYWQALCNL